MPLHSFGRLQAGKGVPESLLTTTTPVVLPLAITKKGAPTSFLPVSKSSSFRKYLRAENKMLAMSAIKDESMPDTPPRFKAPLATTAIVAPLIAPSSLGSLREYFRAEGKKLAVCALSDEPYPEMSETPPRFKKHFIKTITPTYSTHDISSILATHRDAFKNIADRLEEFGSISPPTAEDVFCPEQSSPTPTIPFPAPAEEDFVVIDPTFSRVFNLPSRPSSIRRAVSRVGRLSRRGSDKENIPSHSAKSARVSVPSFSPTKLISRKFYTDGMA